MIDRYIIRDYDELNIVVVKQYLGQDKEGNDKVQERNIGYFANLTSAAKRIYDLYCITGTQGQIESADEMRAITVAAGLKTEEVVKAYDRSL